MTNLFIRLFTNSKKLGASLIATSLLALALSHILGEDAGFILAGASLSGVLLLHFYGKSVPFVGPMLLPATVIWWITFACLKVIIDYKEDAVMVSLAIGSMIAAIAFGLIRILFVEAKN